MVSQKDIAKKLNMTQQAVSAALRSDDGGTVKVAPETRKLVLETARKLGYRSNRYASILKGGKSQLIAIFHGTLTNDWIAKLRSVSKSVIAAGYIPWTIEIQPGEDDKRVPQILDYVLSAKVEGIIMAGTWFKWDPEWFWKQNVPVTSIHGHKIEGVPFFAPDKIKGFREIFYHLQAQGCRRPIICRGIKASQYHYPYTLPPGYLKRDYRLANEVRTGVDSEAMMAFELFCGESRFVPPEPFHVLIPEDYSYGEIRDEFEIGRVLAREALPHKPDALIFTNDSMAVGGLFECYQAGLKVPRDLLLTGFNGEHSTRYSLVPITTMTQPVKEMAGAAVEKLVRMIKTKTLKEDFEQRFECQFESRLSTMYGNCP